LNAIHLASVCCDSFDDVSLKFDNFVVSFLLHELLLLRRRRSVLLLLLLVLVLVVVVVLLLLFRLLLLILPRMRTRHIKDLVKIHLLQASKPLHVSGISQKHKKGM
jgi:hypothetical protein